MVPKGWSKISFKELLISGDILGIQDGNHGNDHPKASDYVDSGIPFVMARDLKQGTIDFSNCAYITKEQANSLRIGFSKPGDILLSHKGTIGEVAIVPDTYEYVMLTPQVTYYRVNPNGKIHGEYLFQYLLGEKYQKEFKTLATQSTRSYLGITAQKALNINIPELTEQKKIAQFLSTWDKAISTTKQLLVNSQQQKKALMQQLLTGKKRLLDNNGVRFSGEWQQFIIEDFFDVGSSKRVLQDDWKNEGTPFYRTRELVSLSKNEPFRSEIFIADELFHELSIKYGAPKPGDFLVSGVGTLGISYQVKDGDKFYFKDGNVLWFKIKSGLFSDYFKYCFQSDFLQEQIVAQASITTVGTYTIQNAKKTKFWCPPSIEEQQKIAVVLSTTDQEIAALQQKLDALKQEKMALMQQLLTGKRRVKVEEAA